MMTKKSRKNTASEKQHIIIEEYHSLKNKSFIKISYNEEKQTFNLALINCLWFQKDNGRILGYDTKHYHDQLKFGECHRHLLGDKTAFKPEDYPSVNIIFTEQYQHIIGHYLQYGTFDSYKINE